MKIEFSKHAEVRLRLRGISKDAVKKVIKGVDSRYYDVETRNLIAFANVKLKAKMRLLCVAYQEVFGITVVVTAHPISEQQARNRILRGRWVKV